MIEIIKYNDDDLKDNEIDEVVTRVRAIIVSSKNDMIVTKTDEDGYQFIGGYVNEGEDLITALKNIVFNETGIALDIKDKIEPFYEVRYYNRDYKGSKKNRLSDLIYFYISSDKMPNFKKLKLTDREIDAKGTMIVRRTLFMKDLKEFIEVEQNPLKKVKAKEVLMAFEKYKEIYKF